MEAVGKGGRGDFGRQRERERKRERAHNAVDALHKSYELFVNSLLAAKIVTHTQKTTASFASHASCRPDRLGGPCWPPTVTAAILARLLVLGTELSLWSNPVIIESGPYSRFLTDRVILNLYGNLTPSL